MPGERTVSVSATMYEQCEQIIEGTNFESVDQYVQFVLSEVLEPDETGPGDTNDNSAVDEGHLEALGYLDR